jgi:hypothetical protein
MSRASWLALSVLLVLALYSPAAQAQGSTPISAPPEQLMTEARPLWLSLYPITQDLPAQFDSFTTTLIAQIASLQANGKLLEASNSSLKQDNGDLTQWLVNSLVLAGTSENQSAQLQTDLDASMKSTLAVRADLILAQTDAARLAFENGLLKTAGIVATIAAVDLGIKAFTGKDAIEWLIALLKAR